MKVGDMNPEQSNPEQVAHNTLGNAAKAVPRHPHASPQSGTVPPVASRWKKGQSGNPKGRPRGTGLTDAVRKLIASEHNGRPLVDILAERIIKEALSGKFPFTKEVWDRLEGKGTEKLDVTVNPPRHYVVKPPRMLNEGDEEYRERVGRERAGARQEERHDQ